MYKYTRGIHVDFLYVCIDQRFFHQEIYLFICQCVANLLHIYMDPFSTN